MSDKEKRGMDEESCMDFIWELRYGRWDDVPSLDNFCSLNKEEQIEALEDTKKMIEIYLTALSTGTSYRGHPLKS